MIRLPTPLYWAAQIAIAAFLAPPAIDYAVTWWKMLLWEVTP